MKIIILILSFISLSFSNILDKDFYMEYIIKINKHNKGVLQIKNKKSQASVKYINIDKNDNLPFFYKQKEFTYTKNKKELKSKTITIDKKYEVIYTVPKDEADDYNIAQVDIKSSAAIKDLDADEVLATFRKNPLNTFEGLILYFMNNKKVNKKQRVWIYEPQKNILFNLGVLKQEHNKKIMINKTPFRTKKITIGRISFDNKKKIPLFEIYTYKSLVLKIKSTAGKYDISLNGIGNYVKGKFSSTRAISERTLEELRKNHSMSINTINPKARYENEQFIISTELRIPKIKIKKKERNYLFNYLQNTDASNLKNKNKFKYVTDKQICSYIHKTKPSKYTKQCKYENTYKKDRFDISDINNALPNKKYQKCEIKDDNNLIDNYKKKLICTGKYGDKEEIKNLSSIGEIMIDSFQRNSKIHYTYENSKRIVQNNKFFIEVDFIKHRKINYEYLIKSNASNVLKNEFFNNLAKGTIKFIKKSNKYGFSINETNFHLHICEKETNLNKEFSYNKGGCYIKNYTQHFNKNDEKGFLSNKLNEDKPILRLIKRDKKERNGEVSFEELKGKASNGFRF